MLNIEFCGAKLLYNIQHIKIPARLAELARLAGIDGKSMRINWLFPNDHISWKQKRSAPMGVLLFVW